MNIFEKLSQRHFVLSSQSPRRQKIFKSLSLNFTIKPTPIDETFDESLKAENIPLYLSKQKAIPHLEGLKDSDILVTADTIVWINNRALNKPRDKEEAYAMLREISGCEHKVFTAVCLTTTLKQHAFVEGTRVVFNELTDEEIYFYLDRYKPFDKAGSYGIQEFIGYIGIKEIHGDFYNVVGFPVQRFWQELPAIL